MVRILHVFFPMESLLQPITNFSPQNQWFRALLTSVLQLGCFPGYCSKEIKIRRNIENARLNGRLSETQYQLLQNTKTHVDRPLCVGRYNRVRSELEHYDKTCAKGDEPMASRRSRVCKKCGAKGHYAKTCVAKICAKRDEPLDSRSLRVCKNCGARGHYAKTCAKKDAHSILPVHQILK